MGVKKTLRVSACALVLISLSELAKDIALTCAEYDFYMGVVNISIFSGWLAFLARG